MRLKQNSKHWKVETTVHVKSSTVTSKGFFENFKKDQK